MDIVLELVAFVRRDFLYLQIVASSPNDLQDYTYYFVPAPWLTVKLMRLLQCFEIPGKSPCLVKVVKIAYAFVY